MRTLRSDQGPEGETRGRDGSARGHNAVRPLVVAEQDQAQSPYRSVEEGGTESSSRHPPTIDQETG